MTVMTAVLFDGDRIDAKMKTVSPVIDRAWFNIGCAGHALAKLALTGHTEAAISDGYATTTDERQAMLKMLVADYCGTGDAFTVAGQPLSWHDDHDWMTIAAGSRLEARWTSNGASCLVDPRLHAHPPASLPLEFSPDVRAAIARACPLLKGCKDPNPLDQGGAHLVSANPR